MKEAISQVRPLNEAWKKRYEKWSINTGLLRKSIDSLPQSAHYDDEIPKSGTTPLITFTPCRPLSADTNLNQNIVNVTAKLDKSQSLPLQWKIRKN